MNRIGKLLLAATWALGPITGSAQGIVRFTNSGPGLNAPVTNSVTGQRVDGSGFLVQLYGGAGGALEPALVPLTSPTGFLSGYLIGYFDGDLATNTFVSPGSSGTFQVRAWSAGFSSYEAAYSASLVDPNVLVGTSSVFDNATGINDLSAAYLTGLYEFSIAPVPEPGTSACLLISAAALLWRLRA
jgi:hypothetical protein